MVRYSLDLGIGSGLLRRLGRLNGREFIGDFEGDCYQWIGSACYGAELEFGWDCFDGEYLITQKGRA